MMMMMMKTLQRLVIMMMRMMMTMMMMNRGGINLWIEVASAEVFGGVYEFFLEGFGPVSLVT